MKKFFLFPILAIFLMCACEPKPIEPEPQTPEELILGQWYNTGESHLSITDGGSSDTLAYDANSFLFTFGNDGNLRMEFFETELTVPGVENTTYELRNDSLILGNGTTYILSQLSDTLLVMDYTEMMGEGGTTYQEHLVMRKEATAYVKR